MLKRVKERGEWVKRGRGLWLRGGDQKKVVSWARDGLDFQISDTEHKGTSFISRTLIWLTDVLDFWFLCLWCLWGNFVDERKRAFASGAFLQNLVFVGSFLCLDFWKLWVKRCFQRRNVGVSETCHGGQLGYSLAPLRSLAISRSCSIRWCGPFGHWVLLSPHRWGRALQTPGKHIMS